MASNYPDALLRERIQQWVEDELKTMKYPQPVSIHLDELLQQSIAQHEIVPVSCRAFGVLMQQTRTIQRRYMASLIIPLAYSEQLEAVAPEPDQVIEQLTREPPSLYLIRRDVYRMLWPRELYSRPTRLSDLEEREDVYVHYDTFRNLEDIQNNWEYRRFIQADHYPKGYRPD